MGVDLSKKEKYDPYEMNIFLIGSDLKEFLKLIKDDKKVNSIKKHWKFQYPDGQFNDIINEYFEKLTENIDKIDETEPIRETLIVKVKNIFDPEINLIIDKINQLEETKYMPLVLLLIENYNEKEGINFDQVHYEFIDPRLFFIAKFSKDPNVINQEIDPILLRICSIHNELGDRFTVGEGNNAEEYDLIQNYYPFNVNIACIGRFGQAKSAGINCILQEYKSKESSCGSSQTKHLTFYQVTNYPVRLLDIPGFEDEKHVNFAIEKFRLCGERINKIKDNLHIILYFINSSEKRTFQELELPILEEIIKHKSSKIIYVVTHCNKNMTANAKKKKISHIIEGIQGISKKSEKVFHETLPEGILYPSQENVVFVNFHKNSDNNSEPRKRL